MAGGDDLLFRVGIDNFDKELLREMTEIFQRNTSCTMSIGIGKNIPEARFNLHRAKVMGMPLFP